MAVPMANGPPFATLNHVAADLGIPNESEPLRVGIRPISRAVDRRKGSKQLLNAGLVRTVVRNGLIVHGAVPSSRSQRSNDHSQFFRTRELYAQRTLRTQRTL